MAFEKQWLAGIMSELRETRSEGKVTLISTGSAAPLAQDEKPRPGTSGDVVKMLRQARRGLPEASAGGGRRSSDREQLHRQRFGNPH